MIARSLRLGEQIRYCGRVYEHVTMHHAAAIDKTLPLTAELCFVTDADKTRSFYTLKNDDSSISWVKRSDLYRCWRHVMAPVDPTVIPSAKGQR